MRVVFFAVAALAAGVFSSPVAQVQTDGNTVQKRQLEQPAAIISALHDAVVAQTGPINETIAAKPNSLAAASEINPRLAAITRAIQAATNQIDALQAQKRSVAAGEIAARQDEGGDGEVCDAQCLTERVLEVVYEIVSTIRDIIQTFGLGNFLSQINPLLLALSILVTSLNVLVTGLLVTVTAVVTTLLGGLGLALLLLGWGA
ncbi:hypothetical protein NLU13_4681 [Sarocladium strictum]|uniref:Uncharacterized protein n=1 Tax=Sarocladium strictum TaxID=5046 RepID=A0AA39GLX9_SARSR|nr:hypothetical protein NLU13_4681 [Sarocladium strictum]